MVMLNILKMVNYVMEEHVVLLELFPTIIIEEVIDFVLFFQLVLTSSNLALFLANQISEKLNKIQAIMIT